MYSWTALLKMSSDCYACTSNDGLLYKKNMLKDCRDAFLQVNIFFIFSLLLEPGSYVIYAE